MCPTDPYNFKAIPLGHKVYVYGGPESGVRAEFYGLNHLAEIQQQLPDVNFVIGHTSPPTFAYEQMASIYQDCLMGLRLTPHDGCSNTVVELGLMGRRCVWNGDLPNAIPWRTTVDVVSAIKHQRALQGSTNAYLAAETRAAIANQDWLLTETYQ